MDCKSAGNNENDFDDNGLQHAFLLASWQETTSSDDISQEDADDAQVVEGDTVQIRRGDVESTEIAMGKTYPYKAVALSNEGGTSSVGLPPETTDEENRQLRPEVQKDAKRGKDRKDNLKVAACHIIKKEGDENVDGRTEIRSREVEANEAKVRSGRSAKDGGCLKGVTGLDIHSSLAYFFALVYAKISCQFSTSLAIGILILMPCVGVGGDLHVTSVPVNTLVAVGDTARINCSTDTNQPVYWARTLAQSHEQQWLFYGADGFHSNNADERFNIDMDEATGRYDLIIDAVQPKDAGQYVCVGESGLGARASAELVISDPINCKSHIPNDGVMGINVFEIKQDFIQFSCNLTYTGNLSPTLEWSWPRSDVQIDEQEVSAAKSFVASTLKLPPSKEHNDVKFRCQAKLQGATQHNIDSRLQWESEAVAVKYAAFGQEQVDACPGVEWNLVCSPQCSYSFEETKDHECRCLYTYYDKRTQKNYHVDSYAVKCAEDNTNFRVVLVTVAAVAVTSLATLAIAVVFFWKNKRATRHSGKAELRQLSIDEESGKSMLDRPKA